MLFTLDQIQQITGIIDFHSSYLIFQVLGKESLTDFDKVILEQNGIDIAGLVSKFPPYWQSYIFGKLTAQLNNYQAGKIEYDDFFKYLQRGQYVPFSKREQQSYEIARQKSYGHIKGLGDRMKSQVNDIVTEEVYRTREDYEKIIGDEIKRGVVDRKSIQSIVSEIGHKTGEWNRDWGRIVETEMQDIFNRGRAEQIKNDKGSDVLVYKEVYPKACFPVKDTEYLTSDGFKLLSDIKGDEDVYSFNLKTGRGEWAKIKSIIRYHYVGDMHQYKNSSLDLVSTPNHNHLVGKLVSGSRKPPVYENELMDSRDMRGLKARDKMYLASDKFDGVKDEEIVIGGKTIKTEYFAKFMGWYLSEGHATFRRHKIKQGGSRMSQICITQTKEHNFEEIREVFSNTFPDRNILYTGKLRFVANLDSSYDDLVLWLISLGKAVTKFIPKQIKELDSKYLEMFLGAYLSGDGHRGKGVLGKRGNVILNPKTIFTSSKKMADDLSEVILKCGYSPGLSVRDCIGATTYKKNGKKIVTKHLRYVVRINKRKDVKNINKYFSVITGWEGEVGCLELDKNYTLFVRRNNKSIWTGNCRHCIRLYLTNGVGSQPKLFRLQELEANGTNIGLKVNDWKPTVNSTHPHCRCDLNYLPKGYVWDEEKKSFDIPKNYVPKVARTSKVKITVGDKVFEV